MSFATFILLALVVGLFVFDVATARGTPRALWLQGFVFLVGGILIVFPDWTTRAAHAVGIGRGVDFVLYPTVLWLVRESLVARRHRKENDRKLEDAVRALALRTRTEVQREDPTRAEHSSA
jgi:small membrane protein